MVVGNRKSLKAKEMGGDRDRDVSRDYFCTGHAGKYTSAHGPIRMLFSKSSQHGLLMIQALLWNWLFLLTEASYEIDYKTLPSNIKLSSATTVANA